MHSLLIGYLLTYEHRVVYLYNLIASNYSCTLSRTIANNILHTDSVLTNGKLDTNTEERTTQVIISNLAIAGADVYRVRIELSQNLRHGLLHQVVDVYGVNILVVDDVQQVVKLVATRVNDVKTIA